MVRDVLRNTKPARLGLETTHRSAVLEIWREVTFGRSSWEMV